MKRGKEFRRDYITFMFVIIMVEIKVFGNIYWHLANFFSGR